MINTTRLRCTIGWLGMLLPWIVLLLSNICGYGFPDSISATYYIPSCITPFMIILGSAALLLVSYKGYNQLDDTICSLAGLFGLAICLFPCGVEKIVDNSAKVMKYFPYGAPTNVGTFGLPPDPSGLIHNISALIFFALLSYNSLFLFTKSNGEMTTEKKKRNLIFRICGIGMIVSFILLIPFNVFHIEGGTWIVEAIALGFFGVSWLTKADYYPWLFADKK